MAGSPYPWTNLPAATALSGNELVPIVQAGTNRTATVTQLAFGSTSESINFNDITIASLTVTSTATIAGLTTPTASIDNLSATNSSITNLTVSATATFAAGQVSSNWQVSRLVVTSTATILALTAFNLNTVNLTISGSATIPTLGVTSTGTFAAMTVSSNFSTLNLTAAGSATIPTLGVTSTATVTSMTVSGNFSVLNASATNLIVSGSATLAAVTVSSNVTLGSSTSTTISNAISFTRPNMPAFMAISSGNVAAVTGDNTVYTVLAGDELYDRTGSYSSATGTFIAPVPGLYNFAGAIGLTALTSNHTTANVNIVAAGYTFTPQLITVASAAGLTGINLGFSQHILMSSGQTALMQAVVLGASKGVAIAGSTTAPPTWFAGYMVG